MKKSVIESGDANSKSKKVFNNRLLYSLIAFGVLFIFAAVVYASGFTLPTDGSAPNPGHKINEISPPASCGSDSILEWNGTANTNGGWSCVSASNLQALSSNSYLSLDSSGKLDVPSNSGNGGYISSGSYAGTGSAAFFPDGIFVPDTSGTSWIYSQNIYLGPPSGSTIHYRGNNVDGNHWSISGSNGYISAGAFIYSSDRRLKTNITDLKGLQSLQQLEKLQGVSFNWKLNGQPDIGFVAQDVQKVYPSLVSDTGINGTLGINYVGLIAPMVEAMKTQQQEIASLQLQVDSLQQQLNDLKSKN